MNLVRVVQSLSLQTHLRYQAVMEVIPEHLLARWLFIHAEHPRVVAQEEILSAFPWSRPL